MSIAHRKPRRPAARPLTNPVLVGTTIVVALIVGVFLSYNANKGLPFVKTFPLNAEVPGRRSSSSRAPRSASAASASARSTRSSPSPAEGDDAAVRACSR